VGNADAHCRHPGRATRRAPHDDHDPGTRRGRGTLTWSSGAWKTPNRPDAIWVADFTYVWTASGFAYTSFITDVYSRRILGWKTSMSKTSDLVTAALAQALATRRRASPRVHRRRVDPSFGCGFARTPHWRSPKNSTNAGIAGSIGTVGDALDNALMEADHRPV
jgi:transposase InsO family protein